MSVVEWRGGIPAVYRGESLGTTPLKVVLAKHLERMDPDAQDGRYSPADSKWMRIQNHDTTNPLRIYFFQDHADNGIHYVLVPARTANTVTWWEGPAEARAVWVAADAGTVSSFDITAFMRRG